MFKKMFGLVSVLSMLGSLSLAGCAMDAEEIDGESEGDVEMASDALEDDIALIEPLIKLGKPNPSGKAIKLGAGTVNNFAEVETSAVPQTKLTINAWFRTSAKTKGIFGACSMGYKSYCDRSVWLDYQGNACSLVYKGDTSTKVKLCTEGKDYADGKWHYATITLGTGGFFLHMDAGSANGGKTVKSTQVTKSALAETSFRIGSTLGDGGSMGDKQEIDLEEVRIWKVAHGQATINAYANVENWETEEDILGEYRFNSADDDIAVQSNTIAGHLPDGTLYNTYSLITY